MDPEIQQPTEFEYYIAQHGRVTDYSKRSNAQLIKDVNKLHEFLRKLLREKDIINEKLAHAIEKLHWEVIWRRILTAAVLGQWAVIGVLFNEVMKHMGNH